MLARLAVIWLAAFAALLVLGPFVLPETDTTNAGLRNAPALTGGHVLGTDMLGRDILARLVNEFRALFVRSLVATSGAAILGYLVAAAIFRVAPRQAVNGSVLIAWALLVLAFSQIGLLAANVFLYASSSSAEDLVVLIIFAPVAITFVAVLTTFGHRAIVPDQRLQMTFRTFGWRIVRLAFAFFLVLPATWVFAFLALRPLEGRGLADWVAPLAVGLVATLFVARHLLTLPDGLAARRVLAIRLPSTFAWSILGVTLVDFVLGRAWPNVGVIQVALSAAQHGYSPLVAAMAALCSTVAAVVIVGDRLSVESQNR